MIKIYLTMKMIHLEFLRIKTGKKWRICTFLKVTYLLEKINQLRAKEAKTEKILVQSRQISWVQLFKNKESSIIKNSKSFKNVLKSKFLRINKLKIITPIASSKVKKT